MTSQIGLGNIMGFPVVSTGSGAGQGIANAYNPYAQQSGPWAQGATAHQQALYNQQMMSIHARQHAPARWMVDGKSMTFQEFVETVFPEDTPERTFFLLKYSK